MRPVRATGDFAPLGGNGEDDTQARMRLIGQRWRYCVGNAKIDVDHAFSWTFWSQDRLRVDERTVLSSGARWRPLKLWTQPWLTPVGEGTFAVTLRSRVLGMACSAELDGQDLTPDAIYEARWFSEPYGWPPEEYWKECESGEKIL